MNLNRRTPTLTVVSGLTICSLLLLNACSSSLGDEGGAMGGADGKGVNDASGGTSGQGASSGSMGAAAGSGEGASSATGAQGSGASSGAGGTRTLPTDITFSYDPTNDASPTTCTDLKIESREVFLDMFVILDKSGSMTKGAVVDGNNTGNNDSGGYCDIGEANVGSRWCNSINSLYGFFDDPAQLETGVSYGEFHSGSCDAFSMDVPFGILQQSGVQLAAVRTAMNDDDPRSGTNTEGAVDTLIAETGSHMPTGTRKTVAILITDGDPSSTCRKLNNDPDEDVVQNVIEHFTELNGLLKDNLTNNGVPTFIIGMDGVNSDRLETLAAGAGATPHANCLADDTNPLCSYYSVGNGDPAAFQLALGDIRGAVLGCEYVLPKSDVGLANISSLEVLFTPNNGATQLPLARVTAENDCTSAQEYWVDFSGSDPIVHLCPATCDTRGTGASVDISLQCEGS